MDVHNCQSCRSCKSPLRLLPSLLTFLEDLPILPALLQASVLALLSAATPLSTTLSSTIIALGGDEGNVLIENPTPRQIQVAQSIHVFAFTSEAKLVLNESQGLFTLEDWETYHDYAKDICCIKASDKDPDAMDDGHTVVGSAAQLIKSALQAKVEGDLYWKG